MSDSYQFAYAPKSPTDDMLSPISRKLGSMTLKQRVILNADAITSCSGDVDDFDEPLTPARDTFDGYGPFTLDSDDGSDESKATTKKKGRAAARPTTKKKTTTKLKTKSSMTTKSHGWCRFRCPCCSSVGR